MKIVSIVGTRPNFVKEALINRRFKELGIDEILVHTGQHYDSAMSDVFFSEFAIPSPHYHLDVPTGSHAGQTAAILTGVEEILRREIPQATLVYGDVTSTLAGALASAKLRIPVVHVEAGIRSQARLNPEEINRRLTDHASSLLLTNTESARQALLAEGFCPDDVVFTGDVMFDILLHVLSTLHVDIHRGNYHLATIHRAENTDSPERLREIVEGLVESGEQIVFPIHPRTRGRLEQFGLLPRLKSAKNIELLPPIGYSEFIKLLAGANKVLTDSGGVRREAFMLGKPVIVLIEIVWFPEIARCGWKTNLTPSRSSIVDAIVRFEPPAVRPAYFGDGRAHEKIIQAILDRRDLMQTQPLARPPVPKSA